VAKFDASQVQPKGYFDLRGFFQDARHSSAASIDEAQLTQAKEERASGKAFSVPRAI